MQLQHTLGLAPAKSSVVRAPLRTQQCGRSAQNYIVRASSTTGSGGSDEDLPPEDVDVVMSFYIRKVKHLQKEREAAAATGMKDGAALKAAAELERPDNEEAQPQLQLPPGGLDNEEQPQLPASTSASSSTTDSNNDNKNENAAIINNLQEQLISALASLDRGIAASRDDSIKIENMVTQLESAGGPVVVTWPQKRNTTKTQLDLLDGRWRLIYSSGFVGGNLGGSRPGPPAALLPFNLGHVYQDIFLAAQELDNVVSFTAKLSLESLSWFSAAPPTVNARLKHSFGIEGPSTVRIVYDTTIVKTEGGIGGWLDSLPQVEPPQLIPRNLMAATEDYRAATFDVSFLDEKMRVTRGDRGELRIYLREY